MNVSLHYKESWETKNWWFWTVVLSWATKNWWFSTVVLSWVTKNWWCSTVMFELFPAVLFPAWASSNLAVCMMYSAYKLNKQDDKIQSWCTPFPIWNQSVVPCLFLIVASWPTYRFLRKQVRWSGVPICLRTLYSWLWSTQSLGLQGDQTSQSYC